MTRSSVICGLFCVMFGGPVAAQVLDEPLVPRGQLRIQAFPSFTSWDERFGRTAEGAIRESLGSDLTDPTGTSLFPAIRSLEEAIRTLTNDPGFQGSLGSTEGVVQKDITRIDFGAHLGVFDWLTVGAVVPWVRTRTSIGVAFFPDTVNGNLGLSPTVSDPAAVSSFLDALSTAGSAAQNRADALCGSSPGSPSCSDAAALADRVESFRATSTSAYSTSAFFPVEGSTAASALGAAVADLDSDLQAAGLSGLFAPIPFASGWLTDEDLIALPTLGGAGLAASPLTTAEPLWAMGDIELSATVRLLEGEVRDSAAATPSLRYGLHAGAVVRLGTGSLDADGVFLDMGTGDAQMDYEARLAGVLAVGGRLVFRAAGRFATQQPVSILRRVAPHELAMPPAGTLRAVRWSPASYIGLEAEPGFRLSETLSLVSRYRFFNKGEDDYWVIGDDPPGSIPVDETDLERESGITLHEFGVGVLYDAVPGWRRGSISRPMRVHARWMTAVSGSGGATPAASRFELGISFFRGFWG